MPFLYLGTNLNKTMGKYALTFNELKVTGIYNVYTLFIWFQVFESLPFAMNFNLEEKIGEGTFSTVYLASRKKSDIKVCRM